MSDIATHSFICKVRICFFFHRFIFSFFKKIFYITIFLIINILINSLFLPPLFSYQLHKTNLPDFSHQAYRNALNHLLTKIEAELACPLIPLSHSSIGLKVYCNSGSGLSTPSSLVIELINILKERGFKRIIILDISTQFMGMSGYGGIHSILPKDVEVVTLDTESYYHKNWFYDNPLPPETGMMRFMLGPIQSTYVSEEDRKSYLPMPFIKEVDYWINLPMVTDHPLLGINGALANQSIWMVSNYIRFLNSQLNGPVAVAEIASIPELQEKYFCTILTLEKYQYIGGSRYNARYVETEKQLWASKDSVKIDHAMWQRLNRLRKNNYFDEIQPIPSVIQYAEASDIGSIMDKGSK